MNTASYTNHISPSGFYSLYDQLISPDSARAIYILKGGPGCGKSTLMRTVAKEVQEKGIETEYILCSGDPDSLDAVIFQPLGVAIVDGTAPHVVEPKYPGLVEQYVNLGQCYDKTRLGEARNGIMTCMNGYKECYQRAYRCLNASAEILDDVRATVMTEEVEQRLAKRAKGIMSREIHVKKNAGPGNVRQRFLSAVTHKGRLCLYGTALAQCTRVYDLIDRYGIAHELLTHLLSGAVNGGYDAVACPDPMAPDRLAHLIIPELSLAFVSSSAASSFEGEAARHIHLDTLADQEILRRSRPRLRFSQKVSAALIEEAVDSLSQAKAMHDELEAIYNPYVNFDMVHRIARDIAQEILS